MTDSPAQPHSPRAGDAPQPPAVQAAPSLPSLSMELFPPRPGRSSSQTWAALDRLLGTCPDFVSVTYRPTFVTDDDGTVRVVRQRNAAEDVIAHVLSTSQVPLMAHLTCIGYRAHTVADIVRRFLDMGVRRFLALRGDPPAGASPEDLGGELRHASDLVSLIREVEAEYFDDGARHVHIAVAAYPAATDHGREVEVLAAKQAAGADSAVTQVFYDAEDYLALQRACLYSGITLPLLPGLIPLTDLRRLTRLEALTGVRVPSDLRRLLDRSDGVELFGRGIDATLRLATDLLDGGAPGLHLYTFNRARPALDVVSQLRVGGILAGSSPDLRTQHDIARSYLNAVPGGGHRMP